MKLRWLVFPSIYLNLIVGANALSLDEQCKNATGYASIEACSKLIKINQRNLSALYYRAQTWHELKQLDKSIADYTEVLRNDQRNPQPYGGRGDVWIDKEEYDLAISDLTEAIKRDKKYAFGFFDRGIAWKRKGNYQAAISDFTEALKLDPHDALAYRNRGNTWMELKNFDNAIEDYTKAININPRDGEAYDERGTAFGMHGSNDKAIADLSKAISLGIDTYNNRGNVWGNKGEFDKAIADYTEAIRLNPNDSDYYKNRGSLWSDKGDKEKAISDYTEAIKLNQNNEDAYNDRGVVWESKGDYDRAISDYNEAIKLNPHHEYAYNNRADAWRKKGDYTKAIADYREMLKIVPNHHNAKENLQLLIEKVERQDNKNNTPVLQTSSVLNSSGGKRIALIIGNSSYKNIAALDNPSRDAELLGSTILKAGFNDVKIMFNLTRQQMMDELKEFEKKSISADWAAIYFAGHGIEISGTNYMLPIDAMKTNENDVSSQTVNIEYALRAVESAKKMRLIILDACRNNPYGQQIREVSTSRGAGGFGASSVGRGLGRIEPQPGTLVVYSAKAGEFALDGDGKNSPFVEALIKRIEQKPPIEVRRLFDFVREDVFTVTKKEQQPFAYGSLEAKEDFFFTQ